MESSAPPRGRAALLLAFILVCLALIWCDLGGPSINGRSEGRYAVVSMNMAESWDWLVPRFRDRPHLTKPPLIYWLEAGCIRLLGPNEWAVRIPSAVAGSLTLLLLFWFVWRTGGLSMGVLAAGVLTLMPMHVVISRLTLTDALLGFFWFATLAFGFLAVREPKDNRWPALLWIAVALGLMTKGPVAWAPVALLAIWLLVGGRGRELRNLRLPLGIVLSLIPLLTWVLLVWHFHPEAIQVWYREMVNRAVGRGDHNEPVWFFVPVFLVGLFPATLMMDLPGLNRPWKSARDALRRGEPACLWAMAVVLPFIMFSLIRGKLASYLLPLCPPLALLTATTLQHWLDGSADQPASGVRPPRVAGPLLTTAAAGLLAAVLVIPRYAGSIYFALAAPLALLLAAAVYAFRSWRPRPSRRGNALAALFVAAAVVWISAIDLAARQSRATAYPKMIQKVQARTGLAFPLRMVLLHAADTALTFYNHQTVPSVEWNDLPGWAGRHPADLVVVAKENDWDKLTATRPKVARLFQMVLRWPVGPGSAARVVLRPADPSATPSTQPDPTPSVIESDDGQP